MNRSAPAGDSHSAGLALSSDSSSGWAGRRFGVLSTVVAWLIFLALLFGVFDYFVEKRINPNQNVATTEYQEGNHFRREISLYRNAYGHYVTSGTMVPYWQYEGQGIAARMSDQKGRRPIGLALIDSDLREGDQVEVEVRGKRHSAVVVPYHLRTEAPPLARPILADQLHPDHKAGYDLSEGQRKTRLLVEKALANTAWRQQDCINLIPSEQTPSRLTRLLSILDPVGRYAEHKPVTALDGHDVFYYQGTEFIAETEALLASEMRQFLGCREVETRLISGQMANTAVFSAMVDYLNRTDRRREPRRMRRVMNHHIIKGGHLSAQPMGALRDFVARDPRTEKPAVVNFPVMPEKLAASPRPGANTRLKRSRNALMLSLRSP